jgi:hypothetical protein
MLRLFFNRFPDSPNRKQSRVGLFLIAYSAMGVHGRPWADTDGQINLTIGLTSQNSLQKKMRGSECVVVDNRELSLSLQCGTVTLRGSFSAV